MCEDSGNTDLQESLREAYQRIAEEHQRSTLDSIKQDIRDTEARLRDYEMDGGVLPDRPAVKQLQVRIGLLKLLHMDRVREARELRKVLSTDNRTGAVH